MENQYDVGIANRYALFLEEGENSLTAIKKKLSKELRQKNKAIKKENAEAKKVETTNSSEKPKKLESKPVTNDVSPSKKVEGKENKIESTKPKEKKPADHANKKDKESLDKSKHVKNNETPAPEIETTEKEPNKPNNDNGAPHKTFENRKPRERKNDNNESYQPKTYNNQYKKYNSNRDTAATPAVDKDVVAGDSWDEPCQNDENQNDRNVRENGFGSHNDYQPRGGGRFRGSGRGGRNNYGGGDRRRDYDQRQEPKDETDTVKTELGWGDEVVENTNENTDNLKDEENKGGIENDASSANEQSEVKEYLTLDEWKKRQGERQKPQYNLRKAGEGEDLTQWKNMRELQKEKDEEFLKNGRPIEKNHVGNNDNEKENTGNENVQRVARQKHIDINVHFREPSSRGGRGGRIIRSNRFGYKGRNDEQRNDSYGGETRSFRKNRDGFQGAGRGSTRQNAPKMDDEHAFPSLG